ncbi:hypothetical protein [Streptomyces kanasensis]|uniref:hypothetical protein n=1 Tax=Streptomyces kanasensis TaxID=936756 RepID=UPI000B23306F|nr:hypothetical protein [Streptomyces kanasensis]
MVKTPAWVSQRLALLDLTPELQKEVESGNLKVEPARRIGRLPKEKQAEEAQKAIVAAKTPRQRSSRSEAGEGQTVNAVNTPAAGASDQGSLGETVNGVNTPVAGGTGQQLIVPCSSPEQVVDALVAGLSSEDLLAVAELLLDRVSNASAEKVSA